VADHRDIVAEVDINPLICAGSDIVAVDGLIVKAG
jgi:acetyl-CoA synthetase